jgi:diguanylate cyclase (GGDEF)-like protein
VTSPLPNDTSAPSPPPFADRGRGKIARKWAYLLCSTTYVPLVLTDLEQPLRELVDELLDSGDRLAVAERIGARLVEMNCVDRASLQITVDVLSGPLLAADPPDRVARVLGMLSGAYAEALRRRTTDQQESMIRAVKAVAMKAERVAKSHQERRKAMATELSLLQRQLSHQLLHDAITGLPNRQFFTTRLEEVLNSGSPTTLYRFELNGFAAVEDGLGSAYAEALLVSIATRLRNEVAGEEAMVARLDRAGFAVLYEQVDDDSLPPSEFVSALAETLSDATYVDDLGLAVTASIGVAQSPPHGTDPTEFLQAADLALYLAKAQGPGQWRLLTPDEFTAEARLPRLAAIMPGAVEEGRLAVGYQLCVGLSSRDPVAVDAYPRWDEAGLAGAECVALAEETGLSPQVGRWLLREAGSRVLPMGLPLSVRLSPNQSAAPDLVDAVLETLSEVSLPTGRLRLAMPAGEIFDGRPQSLDNLTALAKAGVRTAVHDFTGNPSEVVRLPDLPLRTVSLSPRLVTQARAMNGKALMTQAVANLTSLVHETGATIAVDDLRSEPEVEWWRCAGADTASGPLFPIQGPP